MENRILIVADEIFGENGEAAKRFSEILLCSLPKRALQFIISAPTPHSLESLKEKLAYEILGKQAGRIILGLGLSDLKKGISKEKIGAVLKEIIYEARFRTNAELFIANIPEKAFPDSASSARYINEIIENINLPKCRVLDLNYLTNRFIEEQSERGKFVRNLFDESGNLNSICHTLFALFLDKTFQQEFLNKESPHD